RRLLGHYVQMEMPKRGGHVVFVQHARDGYYWSERRALGFVRQVILVISCWPGCSAAVPAWARCYPAAGVALLPSGECHHPASTRPDCRYRPGRREPERYCSGLTVSERYRRTWWCSAGRS